jgi:hypothetical protein
MGSRQDQFQIVLLDYSASHIQHAISAIPVRKLISLRGSALGAFYIGRAGPT